MNRLGLSYVDKLTGFRGVAIGHCVYLTGCSQTLLQPQGADSMTKPEPQWFDDQRLDVMGVDRVVLDNSATPSCDKPAPKP